MWLFSFPSTIYWRDYPFSIVCSLLLCCKLTVHIWVDLFLSSQFCFIDLCMFFCQYHDILITLALKSSMRSGLWYHHLLFLKDTNVLLTKIKPSFHLKWVEAENPGLVTPTITFFLLLKLFNFFPTRKPWEVVLGWEFDSFSPWNSRKVGGKLWKCVVQFAWMSSFWKCCSVQQHPHHLKTCWKCKLSAPTLIHWIRNQEGKYNRLWLKALPGDFDAHTYMRSQGQTKINFQWVQKSKKFNYNLFLNPTIHVTNWWWFLWKAEWFFLLRMFYYHVTFLTRPLFSSFQDIVLHTAGLPLAYLGN